MTPDLISAHAITKHVGLGPHRRTILDRISIRVPEGELRVVLGRSGSGKTTLLAILGGLLPPDAGQVLFGRHDLWSLPAAERRATIRRDIGFVFQSAGLMPGLTASENVAFALQLLGETGPDATSRVAATLRWVGLSDRASHRADELSGGEQQRVALARALVKQPRLLLADEPTSQLDGETGQSILDLMREVALSGTAVLVASHDERFTEVADETVGLEDGRILEPATD